MYELYITKPDYVSIHCWSLVYIWVPKFHLQDQYQYYIYTISIAASNGDEISLKTHNISYVTALFVTETLLSDFLLYQEEGCVHLGAMQAFNNEAKLLISRIHLGKCLTWGNATPVHTPVVCHASTFVHSSIHFYFLRAIFTDIYITIHED